MSMICSLVGITEPQITALRTTPSLATDLAMVSQVEQSVAQLAEALKRLPSERRKQVEAADPIGAGLSRTADARQRLTALGQVEQSITLDKSWHMLHYLFTGHVGPANAPGDLLLTGEDLGEDLGYGPARLHDRSDTAAFGNFLDALDLERLQQRVDLNAMKGLGIYGMPFGHDPDAAFESELRKEIAIYYVALRDYVRTMSSKGNGLLIWLS